MQIHDVIDCGADNYLMEIDECQLSDYLHYVRQLRRLSFRQTFQNEEGLQGNVFVTLMERGNDVLTVTFYRHQKKLRFSVGPPVSLTPQNQVQTMENLSEESFDRLVARWMVSGYRLAADSRQDEERADSPVVSVTLQRGVAVQVMTYFRRLRYATQSSYEGVPLSPALQRHVNERTPLSGHTTLHMIELWAFGNSFVMQLKNGHFIISDGGTPLEAMDLLDYLFSLTPEGQTPVVDAWIISHGHFDHIGVLIYAANRPAFFAAIRVEAFYYNEPDMPVIALDPASRAGMMVARSAMEQFRRSDGTPSYCCRPETGQRYYFCGVTMDVILSEQQLPFADYSGDLNDSTTWCLFTVEGQTVFLGGDGCRGGMQKIMQAYGPSGFRVDFFSLLHHGHNTRDPFLDYATAKTVLCTYRSHPPAYRKEQTERFLAKAEESFAMGEGTRVFTFPYRVGTSRLLPRNPWKHHAGEERPRDANDGW